MQLGYALIAEEHDANTLVRNARRAEDAGFDFAIVSDHFHPWLDRQGQSPFVWSVLGGIARETRRLRVGTGVTCPIQRIHPAIIAQAAATVATMLPGRFFLGVGTGENLNEHVTGLRWPTPPERLEMLEEAIGIIRRLWGGDYVSHRGQHFAVEHARLYSLPDEPPPIYVAASAPRATRLAGRLGDGLITLSPDRDTLRRFHEAGNGHRRPTIGMTHVCWAKDEAEARRTAHAHWANGPISGPLFPDLPTPAHFGEAAKHLDEAAATESVACGPDPATHLEAIRPFAEAGFDGLILHQIGPAQEGFFRFFEEELLPRFRKEEESREPPRGEAHP